MMYILTKTRAADLTASVVGVYSDELQARSEMLVHVESLVTGKDLVEAFHQSATEIRLYKRVVGWLTSSKELHSVLQLIEVIGHLQD